MKKIAVLSGKGGVGKSSITASLAIALSENHEIICADCDVDASNLALVLGKETFDVWEGLSTNVKAVIDDNLCEGCGHCIDACYFDAITWNKLHTQAIMRPYACEGCGLCSIVCPTDGISMIDVENAKIGYVKTDYGFTVVSAQLNIGESGSGKVVTRVRNMAEQIGIDKDIMLIDSAAGIGCPVISSVTGIDYAIIIAEPTPSGFSDSQKALEVVSHFKVPAGIIINKFDINQSMTHVIEEFSRERELELLAKIPFDKKFPKALTELTPIVEYDSSYRTLFNDIAQKVKSFSGIV